MAEVPPPPASATEVSTHVDGDITHSRYETSDKPKQFVDAYEALLTSAGFKTLHKHSGGGGGQYGGSDSELKASKDGLFVKVHAGGPNSGTAHCDVVSGLSENAVDHHDDHDHHHNHHHH